MPQVASKLKKLPRMATSGVKKQIGRVFCVTGVSSTTQEVMSAASSTATLIGPCDTESNSSGYLSSSSFDSSSEEKRLGLNQKKVFEVWEKWSQHRDQPKSSTPKSADLSYKGRINLSIDEGKSVLSIRKNLGKKEQVNKPSEQDSFFDIVTPHLFKSRSENDMRDNERVQCSSKRDLFNGHQTQSLSRHDAGSVPNISSRRTHSDSSCKSSDWKRKPFHTLSSSDQDLRLSGCSVISQDSTSTGYQTLPRYRVIVDDSTSGNQSSSSSKCTSSTSSSTSPDLVSKLSSTCADFMDSGVPVDESMSEFLANVDKDNLASFLNFYDKVTSSAEYERARRNPKNYEAMYF